MRCNIFEKNVNLRKVVTHVFNFWRMFEVKLWQKKLTRAKTLPTIDKSFFLPGITNQNIFLISTLVNLDFIVLLPIELT